MKERYGVDIDPATEICSLIGSKEGLANFFRALCNPSMTKENKDIIMIPDPGYASYKEMIKVCGGIAYPIALKAEDNYMPEMEDVFAQLEKDLVAALLCVWLVASDLLGQHSLYQESNCVQKQSCWLKERGSGRIRCSREVRWGRGFRGV